jgi:hypothetical protein
MQQQEQEEGRVVGCHLWSSVEVGRTLRCTTAARMIWSRV